jgi:hypothetical protein
MIILSLKQYMPSCIVAPTLWPFWRGFRGKFRYAIASSTKGIAGPSYYNPLSVIFSARNVKLMISSKAPRITVTSWQEAFSRPVAGQISLYPMGWSHTNIFIGHFKSIIRIYHLRLRPMPLLVVLLGLLMIHMFLFREGEKLLTLLKSWAVLLYRKMLNL